MTSGGGDVKSPKDGRKNEQLISPPALQQLQLQAQNMEWEKVKFEEEKALFERIKKDLKDLLDGIKLNHDKAYEKVGSWGRRRRGSFTQQLYKLDSKESINKMFEKEKSKEEKKEKDKDKEEKKKEKKNKDKKKKDIGKEEVTVGKDISAPFNFQHRVHVDFDYKWTGQDPDDVFELTKKLGEGYAPSSPSYFT